MQSPSSFGLFNDEEPSFAFVSSTIGWDSLCVQIPKTKKAGSRPSSRKTPQAWITESPQLADIASAVAKSLPSADPKNLLTSPIPKVSSPSLEKLKFLCSPINSPLIHPLSSERKSKSRGNSSILDHVHRLAVKHASSTGEAKAPVPLAVNQRKCYLGASQQMVVKRAPITTATRVTPPPKFQLKPMRNLLTHRTRVPIPQTLPATAPIRKRQRDMYSGGEGAGRNQRPKIVSRSSIESIVVAGETISGYVEKDECGELYFNGLKYVGPTSKKRPRYKSKQQWEWDIYPHGVSKLHGQLRIQIKQRGINPAYPLYPNTYIGLCSAALFRDREIIKLWTGGVLVRAPKLNFLHHERAPTVPTSVQSYSLMQNMAFWANRATNPIPVQVINNGVQNPLFSRNPTIVVPQHRIHVQPMPSNVNSKQSVLHRIQSAKTTTYNGSRADTNQAKIGSTPAPVSNTPSATHSVQNSFSTEAQAPSSSSKAKEKSSDLRRRVVSAASTASPASSERDTPLATCGRLLDQSIPAGSSDYSSPTSEIQSPDSLDLLSSPSRAHKNATCPHLSPCPREANFKICMICKLKEMNRSSDAITAAYS